jgi:hypothetical protein
VNGELVNTNPLYEADRPTYAVSAAGPDFRRSGLVRSTTEDEELISAVGRSPNSSRAATRNGKPRALES